MLLKIIRQLKTVRLTFNLFTIIMSSLFFSVKVHRLNRIIEIDEKDLVPGQCETVFFSKVFSAFQIQNKGELCVKLLNQHAAPIPDGKLSHIMLQYKNCSHFSINVVFPDGFATTFMKLMLFEYLKEHKCDELFNEEEEMQKLCPMSAKRLAQHITAFIVETYSLKPNKDDIIDVCKGTIALFPSLETQPSCCDGIDVLYNVNDHGRPTSGLVYECLRYQNSKESKKKKLVDVAESNETDFDIDELVLFFESCKLPQDTQKLKDKLAETADSRRGVLTQNQRNFPKMFNMYRVDPSLLLYDFKVLFPEVDDQALVVGWESIKRKPFELFQIKVDDKEAIFHCDVEVHAFLRFLKLFQPHKVKLITAVKSLLVFTKNANAEPMELVDKKNKFPHIILIKAGNEKKFYIHIFNRLISVPKDFKFIQVLDMYVKLHKIFQTPFNPHLNQLMSGLTAFVFHFDGDEKYLTAKSLVSAKVFDSINE